MIASLIYIALAVFGLGILIFVHELGHYYMARRVGMRVETFSIFMGTPIYSWLRDGVKWQIGWLPFGGYVKIAGQDTSDENKNPYEVPDGFFGKSAWDRIKVALAGPLVNILLAFLVFAAIWAMGGREKNFAEFTHKIGWVDPESELYRDGVRPGDEIISFNQVPFQSAKDYLYVPMTATGDIDVKGNSVDYVTFHKKPFEYKIKAYPHPEAIQKGIKTTGIVHPANYVIYDRVKGRENPLFGGSPMAQSGIQYGDRVVWVDGEIVFSGQQLHHILNDNRVLLTIFRNGNRMLMRVPRVLVQELKLDPQFKEELTDWQYEAGLNNVKLQKLYAIPYNLTNDAVVENELKFIEKDAEKGAFPDIPFAVNESKLLPKDKIIAIDGTPIKTAYALFANLQKRKVNIIVERNPELTQKISWQTGDADFDKEINWNDISAIASTIGTGHLIQKAGNYVLLNPIVPKTRYDFELTPENQAQITTALMEKKNAIEAIEDPDKRAHALNLLKEQERELLLGIPNVQDRKVNYNPSPMVQFTNVFSEIWNTLTALISGSLSPKWLSGPIGIIQVVQDNWAISAKEALFWLGAISLNLGILNLLPIPVLDGGTILLSLFELVTGRRLHPKTLEKVILPFAVLLIVFFVFLTYQDLSRIFSGFLNK
jgi:regulator of sigma E protease